MSKGTAAGRRQKGGPTARPAVKKQRHGKTPAAVDGAREKSPRFDISIYRSWCKDCGICAEFCPKGVFDRNVLGSPVVARPEDCTGCQECVLHCPDFAVEVTRVKKKGREAGE